MSSPRSPKRKRARRCREDVAGSADEDAVAGVAEEDVAAAAADEVIVAGAPSRTLVCERARIDDDDVVAGRR